MFTRARNLVRRMAGPETDGLSCVLCGTPLYASERSLQVQCRQCGQYVHVRNMRIGGVHGAPRTVTCGDLLIDARARVMGDLVARNVAIEGVVQGNILATGEVRLARTARVVGHVLCANLHVEPGALIEGSIERIAS